MPSKPKSDEHQIKCWTGDDEHVWIHAYDKLPARVRQRLRASNENLCAACLEAFFLPKIYAEHHNYSRERALLAGIELMEAEIRKRGRQ